MLEMGPGPGFNLDDKIKAFNFAQKKTGEHQKEDHTAKPVIKLPTAESFGMSQEKEERLSQIIQEINSRLGKDYDDDVTVKSMLQIKDLLLKSDKLKVSAQNNTEKDFQLAYDDSVDDALLDGLSQNQDFYSLLLNNKDIKEKVMGIFVDEVYHELRGDMGNRKAAEDVRVY